MLVWQSRKLRNQKATKEFYFRFKRRNTKRPASENIDNHRAKRLCLEPENNKDMAGGRIGKCPARTSRSESVNCRHPASDRIGNYQAIRLCSEAETNEGMAGGRVCKSQAKTPFLKSANARHLTRGRTDNGNARKLYRNSQEQTDEKTVDKHENDCSNLLSVQNDSDSACTCEYDSGTEEVSIQTEERLTDTLNNKKEPSPKSCVLSYIEGNKPITKSSVKALKRTIDQENLNSKFKENQRISKPTLSELSNKEEFSQKISVSGNHASNHPKTRSSSELFEGTSNESFSTEFKRSVGKPSMTGKANSQKRRVSKNGSVFYGENSWPKTRSSSKICAEGTTKQESLKSEFNESQCILKGASNKEEQSGIFKRNLVGESSGSRQISYKVKALRVSLMDCFTNGLHARQNFTRGAFQTTSTPKAVRVPTKSTSDITPRVPTSDITPRVPKSQIIPRVPTSHITPPQSEASCTEDESSGFTQEKEFERNTFRAGSKEEKNRKRTVEGIVYKPLFSNKPRLWKSVVAENDS